MRDAYSLKVVSSDIPYLLIRLGHMVWLWASSSRTISARRCVCARRRSTVWCRRNDDKATNTLTTFIHFMSFFYSASINYETYERILHHLHCPSVNQKTDKRLVSSSLPSKLLPSSPAQSSLTHPSNWWTLYRAVILQNLPVPQALNKYPLLWYPNLDTIPCCTLL